MIARLRSQGGFTILEVVIAMTLLSIVSAVYLPLLNRATRTVRPLEAQSEAIDRLRNSLATIGRELRSALCVAQPTANAGSGNVLSFTTEANNEQYSVTYTVTGGTLLRKRDDQDQVILVASGLVGQDNAFTYISTPRRTVKVDFTFQPDPTQSGRSLSTVMAGRNAWHNCS